jgi:hypothetical protein
VGCYRAVHPGAWDGGNPRDIELHGFLGLWIVVEIRNWWSPLGVVTLFRMASLGRMCTYTTVEVRPSIIPNVPAGVCSDCGV